MPLIILHDLNDEEVLVNTDTVTAAKRKEPDGKMASQEAYTKLYFVSKDKTMESMGFPDVVTETPKQIRDIAKKG